MRITIQFCSEDLETLQEFRECLPADGNMTLEQAEALREFYQEAADKLEHQIGLLKALKKGAQE